MMCHLFMTAHQCRDVFGTRSVYVAPNNVVLGHDTSAVPLVFNGNDQVRYVERAFQLVAYLTAVVRRVAGR